MSDWINRILFHDHSEKPSEFQVIDLLKDIRLLAFLILLHGVLR